jgi:predicted phage terminase large subunit-like protein
LNILNWLAREEGSGYFKRAWTPIESSHDIFANDVVVKRVRAWDLASTLPSEAYPSPDYTVGTLIARTKAGYYIVEDVVRGRWRAGELEKMLVEQTQKDIEMYGHKCVGYLPIEPASAGKIQKHHFARVFAEEATPIKFFKVGSGKSKLDRFLPFASVSENGLVIIKEDTWNDTFLTELELFTGSRSKIHDDIVDATADAYNLIATSKELPTFNARLLKMS